MTLHVPTAARPEVAGRLAELRRLRGPAVADPTTRVREVVVIASSSRGGSSMVAEMLRTSVSLLHLRGEINPFLRMVGLGYPDSGAMSDRLDAADLAGLGPELRDVLERELALEIGVAAPDGTGTAGDEQFALDVAARLVMQWPELPFEPHALYGTVRTVLSRHAPAGIAGLSGLHRFHLDLLQELGRQGLMADGWFYDLPRRLLQGAMARPAPAGAPGASLLEEPPFIVPTPWRRADCEALAQRPLVIKAPSNAYRFGFLRALFPNARFRVVHLTRNPAAAVNGLHDGWLHHGFHAHRMDRRLGIAGYVEGHPDNQWWWKFDLPPGWQEVTGAPLLEVCAFQWRSAHQAVLDDLDDPAVARTTIRFEDLTGEPDRRLATFEGLADWLGIPLEGEFQRAVRQGIGPVVATREPRPGRWRDRAARIEAALDPRTLETAERLGYTDPAEWT
ncbi:sulfotransferase [Streptomyces sp. 147326]|uniref:sulfotransferase n=1 Tax=Streptomyces sp. 147326 TaxID=3074379 RepID=UPI003857E12B